MYETENNYRRSDHGSSSKNLEKGYIENYMQKDHQENIENLKNQNGKVKKLLKDAQSKRVHITKQCSEMSKQIEDLENQNSDLRRRVQQNSSSNQTEKYRVDELKFLNKQLTSEIEELRIESDDLRQKLRYSSETLERKYEELEQKTLKRIEQSMKRIKKGIHYLESLTPKEIDKTKDILIQNLRKAAQLLRGKYNEDNCEGEIEELMNPLKNMQEQIFHKSKQIQHLKQLNQKLLEENIKYKNIEKEHLPMYKEAIEKLKKNLGQVRSQLSENQYDKIQLKKKYEEKIKESEYKYNQIFKEFRKMKLEKKIYQNKLEELEADVEEEKERLIGENQMLKKLYRNEEDKKDQYYKTSEVDHSDFRNSQFAKDKTTQDKKKLKKNYSTNELKTSQVNLRQSGTSFYGSRKQIQYSGYNEESSLISQESLKNQICKIDEEIMEIQRNLTKELDLYK